MKTEKHKISKVHVPFLASEPKVLIPLLTSGLTPESHSHVRRKPQYLVSLFRDTMRVCVHIHLHLYPGLNSN